ncbi:MAG TPA: hypothetical protein IGS31_02680 [Oscillatoriales cyanobacterium M4454_W2019_049]|nr:MAG: calcium-binding protein [Cyanobacteria bacterium J055]HIK30248.1 hypothetical protein [Oscillatoriales cyanobacterium M4454_W2019_049]
MIITGDGSNNPPPTSFIGTTSADTMYGLGGDDVVDGNIGINGDILFGNAGFDQIIIRNNISNPASANLGATAFGGADNDTISGGSFSDLIYGDTGADSVVGNAGNDTLVGTNTLGDLNDGGDRLSGGTGNDVIFGNSSNDNLAGGNDNDTLYGGQNDDQVIGDAGNDRLFGDLGNDKLRGLTGSDTMTGGAGNDEFFVNPFSNPGEVDIITDFEGFLTYSVIDTLTLPMTGFTYQSQQINGDLVIKAKNSTGQIQTFLILDDRDDLKEEFDSIFPLFARSTSSESTPSTDVALAVETPEVESLNTELTPLEILQTALDALKAGQPIPEDLAGVWVNPEGVTIPDLEQAIADTIAAQQSQQFLQTQISSDPEPSLDLPTPEELLQLDILTAQEVSGQPILLAEDSRYQDFTALEILQTALDVLKAGQPIPKDLPGVWVNPEGVTIPDLEQAIADTLAAQQSKILQDRIDGTLTPSYVEPPLDLPSPEELLQLDILSAQSSEDDWLDPSQFAGLDGSYVVGGLKFMPLEAFDLEMAELRAMGEETYGGVSLDSFGGVSSDYSYPELSENATDALTAGLAPSPEGSPNPLDVMQEALEALRAGQPIPESNPLAKSGLSIQSLETQIDEILAASEGREILNNSISGNIPNGEVDPLTGSPAPEELPELKVYTPEQQAEIDKILNGEGRGFFFDGEDNVYIEKGWSITVPDYEGRESISYGGLILTNPEFSQDAYYWSLD